MTVTSPRRRGTPRAQSKHNTPGYNHSLDSRNQYLQPCWEAVPDGLDLAAIRLGLDRCLTRGLSDQDRAWLEQHQGRFPYFIHPDSSAFHHLYKRNRTGDESLDDFICRFNSLPASSSLSNHKMVGVSPRYTVKAHTQENYECQLRKLWNFLAMIGSDEAYDAMLILLMDKPSRAFYPSIPLKHITACADHQFNAFGMECRINREPLLDRFNCPIKCAAEITCPDALNPYFSAVRSLHYSRGQNSNYQPKCFLCYDHHVCPE